jgi:ketosteroid isomerase-like protein
MKNNKQILKAAFAEVITSTNPTEELCAKYFSRDYVQYVDGHRLDFNGFVKHMIEQKKVVASVKVTFKHMVEEGDKVATVHLIDATKKDGGKVEGQVNALFQIKNGKIVLCDELTKITVGTEEDKDLGSRH